MELAALARLYWVMLLQKNAERIPNLAHEIPGLFPFTINPDKKSEGNSPQRVCNDGKQIKPFQDRSCHGGIIAKCCHECDKKYYDPDRNEYSNCT
jgi:hypothetical protein